MTSNKPFLFEIFSDGKPQSCSAFPENSSVTFRFLVSRTEGCADLHVYIKDDGKDETRELPAFWITFKENYDIYETSFKCENEALYFLTASYNSPYGRKSFLFPDGADGLPVTVYKKDFSTPDWLKGGIIYQIFPDRFAKSEKNKTAIREDATYKSDWYNDIPDFPEKPGDAFANNCFFGGSLYGVAEKLDYLLSLGVNTVYLNPIFEAASNHKYDTGDYFKVDGAFGGEKALKALIKEIKKRGMHLVLDGVFNHTGDDSVYFNRYGRYDSVGAYQSKESPYYNWYDFKSYPDEYSSWWGVKILPSINKTSEDFREFICGENGVLRHYLRLGIDGWRLDVADELSDGFLDSLRNAVKTEKSDALIIGEVWEDASYKIAYGSRRKYFRGNQLDSVMNYPLRNAITDYLLSGRSEIISRCATSLYLHYPKEVSDVLMNHLGTHDTERILNVLAADGSLSMTNRQISEYKMSEKDKAKGKVLLKLAAFLLYTLPGVPSVYYGDEAGMEGGRDPFNRMPYPWGKEDSELLDFYISLGKLRRTHKAFTDGVFSVIYEGDGLFAYQRGNLICAVNRGGDRTLCSKSAVRDLLSNKESVLCDDGLYRIRIKSGDFLVFKK